MNAEQFSKNLLTDSKPGEVSKYNLRCNRNISERMNKKDFIYDIRPPNQGFRKFQVVQERKPIILPLQLRRKQNNNDSMRSSRMSQNAVIGEHGGGGDADDTLLLSEQRALGFECNFCHERIATLLSLSTHVKFHCRRYCRTCYWILRENETMERHIENFHRIRSNSATNL